MADHNLCRSCETVAHCMTHGCIPITEDDATRGARTSGGWVEEVVDKPTAPERALSTAAWVLATCIAAALAAAWSY